ncbi:MAG: hypothetical protein JO250_07375 [Armatimonadetes bacterium]|nr:hypothetical protein [Armatimonadota bacterium]
MHTHWPWIALALLGAYHGLNPGMGWLFAVSLGLQRRSRRAVLAALPPIALGHAASIAAVAGAVGLAQIVLPMQVLKWALAVLLIGFGTFKLVRSRHPRWVGMQVGFRDLTVWSFLMASAHGAGLMLVPVLLALSHPPAAHIVHIAAPPMAPAMAAMANMPANCPMLTAAPPVHPMAVRQSINPWPSVAAVALHTLSMLAVAGLIALIVYEKLGLSLLRRTWFNLDYLWAAALVAAGLVAALL